ncbi:MAG: preprotein translocase subunit YajC [Bdellovibrio sp.]|nr:preprotein translocase subunit YajC [Bdellovibrio sp.]
MFQVFQLLTKLSVSSIAFAQEAAAPVAAQPAQAAWMQFVPFAVIIGVFYFFLIRPQAKKQKETQSFLSALKVGDQVITQSGILGRITALTDQVATLEVANQVQIRVMRSQVSMSQEILQAKKEVK